MNTVAVQTTQTLPTAVPAQNLLLVPLSQLRPSRRNVRKGVGQSITALAASIQRVGLLQNLTVTLAADGEHYEAVAGGRRLAALKLLAKKRRIDQEYEVPCLLVADASARTASLTENVQREAMHPADQFEAFAALIEEGRPIEDIAADFGVTPLVVQRRLKLANVSPRLMADYRVDAVNLDQLMALAITDDHTAQEAAFYDAPEWQRHPQALRERLTEREIDAHRDPLVCFVGLETYEAAGGPVRRDLFADADKGIYLTDAALLDRLAQDKLEVLAGEVRAEGWAWVEAVPSATYADLQSFQRAPKERRKPNAREAKRLAKLQGKAQEIEAAKQEAIDAEDEDRADALALEYLPINVDRPFRSFSKLESAWYAYANKFMTELVRGDAKVEAGKGPVVDAQFDVDGITYVKPAPMMGVESPIYGKRRPRKGGASAGTCPPVAITFPDMTESEWRLFREALPHESKLYDTYEQWLKHRAAGARAASTLKPFVPMPVTVVGWEQWRSVNGAGADISSVRQYAAALFDEGLRAVLGAARERKPNSIIASRCILVITEEIGQDHGNDLTRIALAGAALPEDLVLSELVVDARIFHEHGLVLACAYALAEGVECVLWQKDSRYAWT